jgi:hypothetical protein
VLAAGPSETFQTVSRRSVLGNLHSPGPIAPESSKGCRKIY